MSEHVRVEAKGALLTIRLNRPERRNAITVAMYEALAEAVEKAAADDSVRAVALTGEGQDFAAGNDLADFLEAAPRGADEIPVLRFLRALACCPKPLLAGVQGNCVGIGTTMLLHCDLVVAEEGTRFSLPFVDLALVPEAASSLLLPELAGRRRAARYLLLCEPFGIADALAIGLVSHPAPAGQGASVLADVAARLLAKPPEALRQTQALLRRSGQEGVLDRMRVEGNVFAERLMSDEVKAAITAFFESRAKRA